MLLKMQRKQRYPRQRQPMMLPLCCPAHSLNIITCQTCITHTKNVTRGPRQKQVIAPPAYMYVMNEVALSHWRLHQASASARYDALRSTHVCRGCNRTNKHQQLKGSTTKLKNEELVVWAAEATESSVPLKQRLRQQMLQIQPHLLQQQRHRLQQRRQHCADSMTFY